MAATQTRERAGRSRPTVRRPGHVLSALPWLVTLVTLASISHAGGARWREVAVYVVAFAVFVGLPGVVAWRLLWSGRDEDTWLDQVVFGTLTGLCLQLPVYVVGRAAGVPRLPAVLPVLALVVALARRDRREVLLPVLGPVPRVLAWGSAAASCFAMLWFGGIGWLGWRYPSGDPVTPNGDEPYQVALTAELKHHFPPQIPTVSGQPLDYHWFVNAHLASMSWLTGLSPSVLQDRLLLPTTTVLVFAATALVAYRLTRSAYAGAAAAVILGMVGDFAPFPGKYAVSPFDEDFVSAWDPLSPSLGYGLALMLLAVHVLLRVLTLPRPAVPDVLLLGLAMAALTGAKATCLPMILCGLLLAGGVILLRRGRPGRSLVVAAAVTVAALVFAQVVLFRGASQGMWFQPAHLGTYLATKLGVPRHGLPLAGATGLLVLSWACAWPGAALLALRVRDSRAVFLLGCAGSGVAATLLLGHPHNSEDYFLRFAQPTLAIASAWGLWTVLADRSVRSRRLLVGSGVVAGVLITLVARSTAHELAWQGGVHLSYAELARPYVVTVALLVVLAAGAWFVLRRSEVASWRTVVVLLAVAITSLGLVRVLDTVRAVADRPWREAAPATRADAAIGLGGLDTARWLREHTSPDDLLATNAHLRQPGSHDNRHAWIAGLGERRVLVEGWSYTPPVLAEAARRRVPTFGIGFFDPALLATNDAAFTRPTAASVDVLRDRYRVRYLVVDVRYPADLAGLERVASLRLRTGDYAVVELNR
ncbi:hypothetical protein PZ938_16670 [Luteipulveratus sp. YIM 133132]|uniref:hypothetical protein n=1 Tax=Luteipulveratus flavus TaxID=3031728 RepID=UPI0023AFAF34|nr:hypothetical protein [Luteipulveratus sp. YIM 133132]MDE9367255.1 hypothetical protein [Luteipulveratus sp. YIM 133132]